jgi:hypothetical protein
MRGSHVVDELAGRETEAILLGIQIRLLTLDCRTYAPSQSFTIALTSKLLEHHWHFWRRGQATADAITASARQRARNADDA